MPLLKLKKEKKGIKGRKVKKEIPYGNNISVKFEAEKN